MFEPKLLPMMLMMLMMMLMMMPLRGETGAGVPPNTRLNPLLAGRE